MKKHYSIPEIAVSLFITEDIITTSGTANTSGNVVGDMVAGSLTLGGQKADSMDQITLFNW